MTSICVTATTLCPGNARGTLAVLGAPLSLWGGLDLETGAIADATHPQWGQSLKGRVLAMRTARGSSSSSSALVEAARRQTAPCAIVLTAVDPILAIGVVVAAELYGVSIPMVLCRPDDWSKLIDGQRVEVDARPEGASILLG